MTPATDRPLKLTVRVDGSFDFTRCVAGVGLVLHAPAQPGRNGPVIDRLAEAYCEIPPGRVEHLAIFRALLVAQERGFEYVKVRSDCNPLRTRLKKDHKSGLSTGSEDLYGPILRLAREFVEVKFAYTPRRKNQEPHHLARQAAQTLPAVAPPPGFLVEAARR